MSSNMQQIAVVTGANSGLGLECVKALTARGISTLMVARRGGILKEEAAKIELKDDQTRIYTFAGDVGEPNDIEGLVKFMESEGLSTKWLLNNAGVGRYGEIDSYSYDDMKDVLNANLLGMMLMTQKLLGQLLDNEGVLCNIMSTAALNFRAKETVYTAAKWGARGFTEALRAELKGQPVRIMAVYPGGMNTPFWDQNRHYVSDPSKFMPAEAAADRIVANLLDASNCQVSDITINRL